MSNSTMNSQTDTISQQVAQLETDFKKKQSRSFQIGYPVSMTLLVGSIALWIIFTGALMMSRIGSLAGFLIGCLVFSLMILCFRNVYKRWDRKSTHNVQQTANEMFDTQFPAAQSETRQLAMHILHDNFDTYSLAQVLLTRQQPADVSAAETSPPLQAQQF
jgi:hypothetical protein